MPLPPCETVEKEGKDGKEDRYERDPGMVPLAFNYRFFEPFKRFKKLAQRVEKDFFDTLTRGTALSFPHFFVYWDSPAGESGS